MRLVSVSEMRQIENQAFGAGISSDHMIQTVGLKIANILDSDCSDKNKMVLGLIGKGNNGSDTLAILTYLAQKGWETFAWLLSKRESEDRYLKDFLNVSGKAVDYENDTEESQLDNWLKQSSIILDGIYGIGFHLPLGEAFRPIFRKINQRKNPSLIYAIDCPSGMDCDTGKIDPDCIRANRTICIEAVKIGEVLPPANLLVGELETISLDLPQDLTVYQTIHRTVLDSEVVRMFLPIRPEDGNKSTFGTVTIVGGSEKYIGAPKLSGIAAFKAGCGYVNMVAPEIIRNLNAGIFSQAIWQPADFNSDEGIEIALHSIRDMSKKKGSLVIGPGLGQSPKVFDLVHRILISWKENPVPLLMDADGLNALPHIPDWQKNIPDCFVITPHEGEMARLCNMTVDEIKTNRIQIAEQKSKEWKTVIVLKGAFTVIASPDGYTAVMPYANSILAKAGSGDILSGLIGGFLAQRSLPFEASCLGVWVHAKAAQIAFRQIGQPYSMSADDLLSLIPEAIRMIYQSLPKI
ncbi:MAG TPA: NAD(P)H-hydrate dehydratase [Flexilinea sp.]|nr:NAD(P)H-hydrate dehydratase [Flexilinea sp.]